MNEIIVDVGTLKLEGLPRIFSTRDWRAFVSGRLSLDKGEALILLLALREKGVIKRRGFSRWSLSNEVNQQ